MDSTNLNEKSNNSYLRQRWPFATIEEGSLNIKNSKVEYLAKRFGTPFYLIVEDEVHERLRRFKKAFPYSNLMPQYAVKCNSNIEILRIVKQEGFEADASSVGEIILALLAGFEPNQVTFTTPYKSEQDILFAARVGVKAITIDCLEELERAIRVSSDDVPITVFIRINPKITLGEYTTIDHQYGIPIDLAKQAIERATAAKNIRLIGFHWHGGYVPSPEVYKMAMRKIIPLAKYAYSIGNNIEYLDFGGGFPAEYGDAQVFNPEDFGDSFVEEFEERIIEAGLPKVKLIFEPGKFIVAAAGIGITKVVSVKKIGERDVAIVDGSTYAMLPDPLICDCYYHILPANKMEMPTALTYDIHGCTCDCLDKIGKKRQLPELKEGDILAVMDCGAYSTVLTSNFNTLKRPPVILLKEDGATQVIRRRDTYSEMFAAELDLLKDQNMPQLKTIYNLARKVAKHDEQKTDNPENKGFIYPDLPCKRSRN